MPRISTDADGDVGALEALRVAVVGHGNGDRFVDEREARRTANLATG